MFCCNGGKRTKVAPPKNLTCWILKTSKGFTPIGLTSDYSIADDIARYQGVLEHAMSKVDFSVGGGVYMLPSNMNLNINKPQGFNNNILISESSYKLGLNNKVNVIGKQKTAIKPKQKTAVKTTPKQKTPKKLLEHEKISVQNHNDEKIALSLLMTGTVLLVYYLM